MELHQNLSIILVCVLIIFLLINSKYLKEEKFNSLGNELYNIHQETDLKNGYIGVHPNIYKKSKDKDYYITSRYNFNLTTTEKTELKRIVNPIIKKINQDLNLKFHFVDYEHVTTQVFNNGDKRMIVDFFIHETNKYYDKRLIADVYINTNNESMKVNSLNIGNGKIEKTSDILTIPEFSQKIISDNNFKNTNTVIGNETNSLEYNILKDKPINFISQKRNFTKWILPDKAQEQQTYPCRDQEFKWNQDGILNTEQPKKNCFGINNTFRRQLQKPKFLPSFKNQNQKDTNNWLWGESRGTGTNKFSGGSG